MSEKFNLSYNDTTVSTTLLFEENLTDYSQYSLYVENKNSSDEPLEANYGLYNMFDSAVDILSADNSQITIGERVSSQTQILSTNNTNQITAIFGRVTSDIDYEGINALLSKLNTTSPSSEISSQISSWLSKFVNFSINRNPEDADESNLILTQALLDDSSGQCYVQRITESILNKIFRNLIQLIRVKHDYRLYGKGTTIFGGKSSRFSSAANLGTWSGLNPNCWSQVSGNYVVGRYAYGDEITRVSSTLNGTFSINPNSCYGIAAHDHNVTMTQGRVPSTINTIPDGAGVQHDEYSVFINVKGQSHNAYYCKANRASSYTDWFTAAKSTFGSWGFKGGGFVTGTGSKVKISKSGEWSYSWNSDNCRLSTTSNMASNIFSTTNTVLPTYSSYVWVWTRDDDTNITSPRAHIQ